MTRNKRYQCNLPQNLLEKAVRELNEPRENAERLKAIDDLRSTVKKSCPEIELLRDDDLFFLAFLRAKKFNQEKALKTMVNFHNQRRNWPEVMDKVSSPVVLGDFLSHGPNVPLKGKAKDGSTLIVGRPGIGVTNSLTDFIASSLLTIQELVLEDEETQISGVTNIEDLAYVSLEFAKQMNPSLASKSFGMVQDAMPVRLKGLNITNEPKFFEVFWAIVSPFMAEKQRKRFRVHGTDFTNLYEEVADRSVLPHMFAGTGPELPVEEWKIKLMGESTAL